MLKHNNTSGWLKSKSQDEQASLLEFALKKGHKLRKRQVEQEQRVKEQIVEKMAENERMRVERQARQDREKEELTARVQEMGGACESAADVDRLVERFSQGRRSTLLANLKFQIRYQKVVLRTPGHLRLTGSIEFLAGLLKEHFVHVAQEGAVLAEE